MLESLRLGAADALNDGVLVVGVAELAAALEVVEVDGLLQLGDDAGIRVPDFMKFSASTRTARNTSAAGLPFSGSSLSRGEVSRRVIGGTLNKQIAAHLGIAGKTVKIHRGRVMQKLALGSVAELVSLCQQAGIQPLQAS